MKKQIKISTSEKEWWLCWQHNIWNTYCTYIIISTISTQVQLFLYKLMHAQLRYSGYTAAEYSVICLLTINMANVYMYLKSYQPWPVVFDLV